MNYCNDCYFFKRTIKNQGHCLDLTKIIYTGYGGPVNEFIYVLSSHRCMNWVNKNEMENSPAMANGQK